MSLLEDITDEIAGFVIGAGYYSAPITVDEARDIAKAVLDLLHEEWGVRQGTYVQRHSGEDSARWYVNQDERPGRLEVVSRRASDWEAS